MSDTLLAETSGDRGSAVLPRVSGGLPLVGHFWDFIFDCQNLLQRARDECGEVAAFRVAHMRMVLLTGPSANEAFFRAPDDVLSPSAAYELMVPVFGKDVVYDAPPEKMWEQLGMLMPALRDQRMRTYGDIIASEVERSLADWGEAGELDLVSYCQVLTNFTSSHCLLGPEFRNEMTEEFAQVYHDMERGITPAAYISPYLPLPSFRKRDRARVRLVEMITEIIAQRRHTGRCGEDFLQTLMDAKYKNGLPLSEHEITGLLLAGMFAGHHTSSVTTAWTLLELLRHPEILHGILVELDEVYGDSTEITFASLRRLHRLEWAIKESLRLHPPLFMLLRRALREFHYSGYTVPAGTYLVTSPAVSHRIPTIFHDPDRFDPERFAPGREEDKEPFTFISFGGGRHKCMGNAFALLQVKTIFAMLLTRYEFELAGDPIEGDFHGVVVGPKQPCRLRYRLRQSPVAAASVAARHRVDNAPEPRAAPCRIRIEHDGDLCQGHAVCMGEAPEVFTVDRNGATTLIERMPRPALYERVRAAARYCPTGAIRIVEENDEEG